MWHREVALDVSVTIAQAFEVVLSGWCSPARRLAAGGSRE